MDTVFEGTSAALQSLIAAGGSGTGACSQGCDIHLHPSLDQRPASSQTVQMTASLPLLAGVARSGPEEHPWPWNGVHSAAGSRRVTPARTAEARRPR